MQVGFAPKLQFTLRGWIENAKSAGVEGFTGKIEWPASSGSALWEKLFRAIVAGALSGFFASL